MMIGFDPRAGPSEVLAALGFVFMAGKTWT